MSEHRSDETADLLRDGAVKVTITAVERLATAYYDYDQYRFTHRGPAGETSEQSRTILQVGRVVAVITVDLARDEIVLIRQFRLAAHLATGRGEMVEIVAGGVEEGEDLVQAARRECIEEIAIDPERLVPLFDFMPAPGVDHELATMFLAVVDAAQAPARAGAGSENEETVPLRVSIDDALAALAAGTFVNGYTVIALQWLARNRAQLREIVGAAQSP
ncbi:MAG: NUDIX domain-containing protein [Rhizobiales bacterium]|nr:NUDIX domain-containing protein [Hyphomicrobiales bacterium]